MRDAECVELLQWALPRLGLRWSGFRRNKRQVCRRVRTRLASLGLADARAYAAYLERHAAEWEVLEALCGITISRFFRDRPVFDCLAEHVLPALAGELPTGQPLRVWSAGCASGEEPYSIALMWEREVGAAFRGRALRVLGTDRDPRLLARAARGCYRASSLRELPPAWVERSFERRQDAFCLEPELRRTVTFECQDLRRTVPAGCFELILCRNLAFSYFEVSEQRRVLQSLADRLRPDGYLVIGLHEELPDGGAGFRPVPQSEYMFRRAG